MLTAEAYLSRAEAARCYCFSHTQTIGRNTYRYFLQVAGSWRPVQSSVRMRNACGPQSGSSIFWGNSPASHSRKPGKMSLWLWLGERSRTPCEILESLLYRGRESPRNSCHTPALLRDGAIQGLISSLCSWQQVRQAAAQGAILISVIKKCCWALADLERQPTDWRV